MESILAFSEVEVWMNAFFSFWAQIQTRYYFFFAKEQFSGSLYWGISIALAFLLVLSMTDPRSQISGTADSWKKYTTF